MKNEFNSIIGMKFGRLTVVQEAGRSRNQAILWECKCDCGAVAFATSAELKSGHKKSCGCLKRVSRAIDLKGQRFGMLVAKRRVGTNKHRKALWRCKCDCGNLTTVSSVDLKSGNTKSCGCLGSNYAKRNLQNWSVMK